MARLTDLSWAEVLRKACLYTRQFNALQRMGCGSRPIATAVDALSDEYVVELIRRSSES